MSCEKISGSFELLIRPISLAGPLNILSLNFDEFKLKIKTQIIAIINVINLNF